MNATLSPTLRPAEPRRKATRGVIEARFIAADLTPEEEDARNADFFTRMITHRQADEAAGVRFIGADGEPLPPLPSPLSGIMSHG